MTTQPASQWPAGPQHPQLRPGEIHVWKYSTRHDALDGASLTALRDSLDPEEQQRLARISSAGGQDTFIVSHGRMRLILARYLALAPGDIQIQRQASGKPRLAAVHASTLEFNLSHSHGLALVAVCDRHPVGVDIEKLRDNVAYAKLARRFFSSREAAQLLALPQPQQLAAFISIWTSKEALIKASGIGIAQGLQDFELSVAQLHTQQEVASRRDPDRRWSVYKLPAIEHYCAALACAMENPSIHCWDLQ